MGFLCTQQRNHTVSKTCSHKQGNRQPRTPYQLLLSLLAETAVRRGGRYYCLGKCLWCEVRERHLFSVGMTEHVMLGRIGVFRPYAHIGSVNQTRITGVTTDLGE